MQHLTLTNTTVRLEYAWFNANQLNEQHPQIVLLHEGLGCVAMWREFPQALADATECSVLAYSRQGYGGSTAIEGVSQREVDFMHREAEQVLPELLRVLNIENPVLVGHSDGASIALLAASKHTSVRAVIAMAPHLFVEPIALAAIADTRAAYEDPATHLKSKLSKFHRHVDTAFYGWANIWLKPAFAAWNIEQDVATIACPILAIQGEDDQYGTMQQIDQLQRLNPRTQQLKLARCRHSPHLDQPVSVVHAISDFITALRDSTEAR
jgi:pimeloyl-ACP methyl ester carboxylesterase